MKRDAIATTFEERVPLLETEKQALNVQVKSLVKSSKADSTIAANKTEEFMMCDSRLTTKENELENETKWKKLWKSFAIIATPIVIVETALIYFTLKQ